MLVHNRRKKSDTILIVAKIALISLSGLFLIGNFNPYFEGNDAYSYAIATKLLVDGSIFYSNELLELTGRSEFIPQDHMLTNDGQTALPAGYVGFFGITALAYLLGGDYGLFFLGPISGIIFLIVSERISTHFFGKYVGLLTLLFLSTNHYLFRTSLNLQNEAIFTTFFLLGCYFLINFLKNNKKIYLLTASSFLVFSTATRLNGIVSFPVEIIMVMGFFFILKYHPKFVNKKFKIFPSDLNYSISKKYILKILVITIVPWLIFFLFYMIYFGYFFDDPLTTHVVVIQGSENTDKQMSSILKLDSKNFENVKQYSKYLLPYQFPRVVDLSEDFSQSTSNFFGDNWLGVIALSFLIFLNIVSLKTKSKRLEIIVFSLMIFSTVWFFSSVTTESRAIRGVPGRYMFPAFTLNYMIIGFAIFQLLYYFKNNFKRIISIPIISFIMFILVLFFIFAYVFSPPIQAISNETFQFNDPTEFEQRLSLDIQKISTNDVVITLNTYDALDYGLIPFNPKMVEYKIREDSFELLQTIDEQNYNIYIFKNIDWKNKLLYESLLNKKNISFLDYSPSLCKVIFHENNSESNVNVKTDTTCM